MWKYLQEMSTSGDLERMKSLSSAGHHGGVRVFHDTVEIARGLAFMASLLTVLLDTLPETNIAPENRVCQKETSIPTIHFQVLLYVSFREGRFFWDQRNGFLGLIRVSLLQWLVLCFASYKL